MRVLDRRLYCADDPGFYFAIHRRAMFAIGAHDHLIVRDDAGLNRRRARIIRDQ